MEIRSRRADVADFENCESLTRSAYPCCGYERCNQLRQLWEAMRWENCQGGAVPLVIEASECGGFGQIVAFSFSIFMGEGVCSGQTGLTPWVNDQFSRGTRLTSNSTQLGQPNYFSGLSLFIPSYAWVRDALDADSRLRIVNFLIASFLRVHTGYNIERVIVESCEQDLHWLMRCGFRISGEAWSEQRKKESRQRGASCCNFVTLSLTRNEALMEPGTLASFLFIYNRPRFRFKLNEQELLKEALAGRTDTEISHRLNVTLSTVKKRWTRIYDEVISVDFALIPHAVEQGSSIRGKEKRRYILGYLRHHPEELLPVKGINSESFWNLLDGQDRASSLAWEKREGQSEEWNEQHGLSLGRSNGVH